MKCLRLLLMLLVPAVLSVPYAAADGPCSDEATAPTAFVNGYNNSACKKVTNFTATPLMDGSATTYYLPGNPNQQIVSLYGIYGNIESPNTASEAVQHYNQGLTLASQIQPLCSDGTVPGPSGCSDTHPAQIVFLFLGFSNCDVEICGGHADAWDAVRAGKIPPELQLAGQACATQCPNLHNPSTMFPFAFNRAFRGMTWDGYDQMSLLRQVYPDNTPADWLVGPSVVVFDGALGGQTLEKWDPTSIGYYANPINICSYNPFTNYDPEYWQASHSSPRLDVPPWD